MNEPDSIDLLKPKTEHIASRPAPELSKKKKRVFSGGARFALFGFALLFIGVFLFSSSLARSAPRDDGAPISLFSSLRRLVASGEKAIAGEENDRINILLLGIGGTGHDGPELTDTIMFGSFKPSTKELGIISVPRDLTVSISGYGYRKINHVNALAENAKDGSGPAAAAETISTILGQPVHYTVKIDFDGFAEVIDAIGGIDVYVERDFTDNTYPLDDGLGNVETLSFTKGWTRMDGSTALKFARSRHGGNGEGTDFARAARQQKILLAMKDRTLSLGVLLNPSKLTKILGTVENNIETNMTAWEMVKFAKYIPDISPEKIAMHVLDTKSSQLYETYVNGSYVILPYKDDWSDLHRLATNIFNKEEGTNSIVLTSVSIPKTTPIKIEVQNGTATSGLAAQTAQLLQSSGFDVVTVSNAENRLRANTVIYDFTGGARGNELSALKEYLHAEVIMTTEGYLASRGVVPTDINAAKDGTSLVTSSEKIDFLVILGQDSTNLVMRY